LVFTHLQINWNAALIKEVIYKQLIYKNNGDIMMSRKNTIVFVLAIFMSSLPVLGASFYTCSFEQNEQINGGGPNVGQWAFVTGDVNYQGDPCWHGGFVKYGAIFGEATAYVEQTDSDTGSQCLHVYGHQAAYLSLAAPIYTEVWLEFAFKPNFDGSDPLAYAFMQARRGSELMSILGLTVTVTAGTGKITLSCTDTLGTRVYELGDFVNHQWQTISIRHRAMIMDGVPYLSDIVDIFLGSKYIMTVGCYNAYHSLGTIIFATANGVVPDEPVHEGDWFIDSIHIGSESVLANLPTNCGDRNTVYLDGDISGPVGEPDCYLNLYDLAALAGQWLQ
jgi:hypothetical protein